MGLLLRFYGSTIGKKIVMAITGLLLVGFVVGHMAGNFKVFAGVNPDSGLYKLDEYAEFLRSMGHELLGHMTVLWLVRIGLLTALVLHVVSAIQLARLNRRAGGGGYAVSDYRSANAASRTMLYGGLFLLAFIIFHILHFTTGDVHQTGFIEGRVYDNVTKDFQLWYVVALYLAAMAALAAHLYHGAWSMFQTLGVTSPAWNGGARVFAKVLAVVLFVGFSSVPVAAYLRLVPVEPVLEVARGD